MEPFNCFRGLNIDSFIVDTDLIEKGKKPAKNSKKEVHTPLGKTQSGKGIYARDPAHSIHADYSGADHIDAADHFESYTKAINEHKYLDDEVKVRASKAYSNASKQHRALGEAKSTADKERAKLARAKAKEVAAKGKPKPKADEAPLLKSLANDLTEDFEKGQLAESLTYQSDIKFEKTGAELKTAIIRAIDLIQARAAIFNEVREKMLSSMPCPPCESVSRFRYGKPDGALDLKGYPWEMTDWNHHDNCVYGAEYMQNRTDVIMPTTAEEAKLYREYNNNVNCYVECLNDTQILGVYTRNLEDERTYTCTPELLHQLGL